MTAVSLLSSDSVFLQPYRDEEKKKAGLAHRRFASREGDLLTLITIYEAWTKVCSREHSGEDEITVSGMVDFIVTY